MVLILPCMAMAQLDLDFLKQSGVTAADFQMEHIETVENKFAPACYALCTISLNTNVPFQNYVDNLSFFCKLEVKTDRKARIPVRVRLGTVQYVDMLEQKYQGYEWINGDRRGPRLQPVFQR